MRQTGPAADASLGPERLFGRLAAARGLVIAVSGGPDSTALMLLVARWDARPPALVVTVDHGIRPEAADEARLVAENAERLGLPWRIMRVPERASGNLQDWARRVRYGCLAAAAETAGFDTIVTAHHQDDQAETFLLRLARGSGAYGLGAMAEEGSLDSLRLVRPLLGVPRRQLAQLADASGLAIVVDPSNSDPRFDRVRLRGLMPSLAEHGITAKRLAGTAGQLRRAAAALDHYAEALLKENFRADAFGVVAGPAAALADVPEEIGLRALALILRAVGGAEYTPPIERIEALREAILATSGGDVLKRTLHGVVVTAESRRIAARREWGRQGPAATAAPAGSTLLWDRRFSVRVPASGSSLSVGPLGRAERRLQSAFADRAAIRALPGLFAGDELVAVPDQVDVTDEGTPLDRLPARCVVGSRLGLASEAVPRV